MSQCKCIIISKVKMSSFPSSPFCFHLNSKPIKILVKRVGALWVAKEERNNLKEVTMATQTQSTSRHHHHHCHRLLCVTS